MAKKQPANPKDNPIRILRKASQKQIEIKLDKRVEEILVANRNSGGAWGDYDIAQLLNNELTGRYIKRTTVLALFIAGLSLFVSLVSLFISLGSGNIF